MGIKEKQINAWLLEKKLRKMNWYEMGCSKNFWKVQEE